MPPVSDFAFYAGNGVSTIISLVLSLALLGAGIFVAVDAGKRPDWAHQQAGAAKGLWIGLGIAGGVLGLCCCILGLPVPIIWFAVYRNKVIAAEQGGPHQGYGGPPPGGYGGPPPGYGPPPGGGFPPPPPAGGGFPPPPGGGFPPPPAPPTFGQ